MTPRTIPDGTLLGGRYLTVALLGTGGMGQVLEANDERLGRHVAVKLVTTTDPTASARLRAEATVLARLRHPNIVNVFDVGEHDGRPFVVTELVRGRSLGDRLSTRPIADPGWVASMGSQIASALACAHEHGVVHRDLKPSNILLAEPGGDARLIDFGIAVSESAMALTSTGMVIGTPAYLSPEQVEGRRAAPPSDVYALGLVLTEALRGERLFPGTPAESTAARLHADAPIPSDVPPGWASLLRSMTLLEPDRRVTAEEVASRLRQLDESGTGDRGLDATTTAAAITSSFAGPRPGPAPDAGASPTDLIPAAAAVAGAGHAVDPAPFRAGTVATEAEAVARRRRRLRSRVPAVLAAVAFVAALVVLGAMAADDDPGSETPTPSTEVGSTQVTTAPTTAPPTTAIAPAPRPTPPTTPPTTETTTTTPDRESGQGRGRGNGPDRERDD